MKARSLTLSALAAVGLAIALWSPSAGVIINGGTCYCMDDVAGQNVDARACLNEDDATLELRFNEGGGGNTTSFGCFFRGKGGFKVEPMGGTSKIEAMVNGGLGFGSGMCCPMAKITLKSGEFGFFEGPGSVNLEFPDCGVDALKARGTIRACGCCGGAGDGDGDADGCFEP